MGNERAIASAENRDGCEPGGAITATRPGAAGDEPAGPPLEESEPPGPGPEPRWYRGMTPSVLATGGFSFLYSITRGGRTMGNDLKLKEITPKSEDFSQWYSDVVLKAELADYAPVRGCIAVRPYGYAIWERIQAYCDTRFKETGVENAYFPMFIPESIFAKEAEHIEGFAPEAPWVTHAGGEELAERLAIRPSSETIIGTMFARWVQSYRDLPILLNQWCSVVRWEKATRPFLRTSEFLWQEGHTCHRTAEEADQRARIILGVYTDLLEKVLAIPALTGLKTESEKFAGAVRTYSLEPLMADGRALQAGTSHYLGDGFARVLGIQFLDEDGRLKHVHQSSWGVSHRLIGALIMVHGDDRGLILPPAVAPHQVVIVPIYRDKSRDEVLSACRRLRDQLAMDGFRTRLDDREEFTPGWKFSEWEMRGVPLRLELGPRDLKDEQVVVVRRDTGEKIPTPMGALSGNLRALLDQVQAGLYDRALKFQRQNTRTADSIEQLAEIMGGPRGFVLAGWCGEAACEKLVKERTGATIRCLPFDREKMGRGPCIGCGQGEALRAPFARAY